MIVYGIFEKMRKEKVLFTVILVAVAVGVLEAQQTTYKGKKLPPRRSYNDPSLSRAKTGSPLPIFDEAGYPYQGIGIKAGDPIAITFKFYMSERIALVADFGRSTSSLYKSYYTDLFDTYFPDPSDTLSYDSHKLKTDWAGELKFVYHFDATKFSKGLRFYTGLGWQIRDTKLEYQYSTKDPAVPQTILSPRRHQTQGIVAVLGTEYSNFTIPIALFVEASVFRDLDKDPGWTRAQGGVGIRYIF